MLLSQLVKNVGGIETGVVAELAWDNLESAGDSADQHLLLTGDAARHVAEVLRQLHLDSTAT